MTDTLDRILPVTLVLCTALLLLTLTASAVVACYCDWRAWRRLKRRASR